MLAYRPEGQGEAGPYRYHATLGWLRSHPRLRPNRGRTNRLLPTAFGGVAPTHKKHPTRPPERCCSLGLSPERGSGQPVRSRVARVAHSDGACTFVAPRATGFWFSQGNCAHHHTRVAPEGGQPVLTPWCCAPVTSVRSTRSLDPVRAVCSQCASTLPAAHWCSSTAPVGCEV